MTMTKANEILGHDLGQVQKYGSFKPLNGIPSEKSCLYHCLLSTRFLNYTIIRYWSPVWRCWTLLVITVSVHHLSVCLLLQFLVSYLYTIWHRSNFKGPSWSWSYGCWIYNYLCNQCLLPLKLWVWTRSYRGVLDITLCDKVCQWLATDQWFSLGTPATI